MQKRTRPGRRHRQYCRVVAIRTHLNAVLVRAHIRNCCVEQHARSARLQCGHDRARDPAESARRTQHTHIHADPRKRVIYRRRGLLRQRAVIRSQQRRYQQVHEIITQLATTPCRDRFRVTLTATRVRRIVRIQPARKRAEIRNVLRTQLQLQRHRQRTRCHHARN